VLGTLLVIVGVVVYAVLSSLLTRAFMSSRLSGEISCALLPLSMTGIGVAFFLYEVIFVTWQVKISRPDSYKVSEAAMNKIFSIIFAACVSISLLFAIFSANTYVELGENSMRRVVCFVTTEEYSTDDVARFTFSCDENGSLEYKIKMKNGEEIELFGTVNSCSDEFIKEYGNMYGYAAHLTEKFRESNYIIEEKIIGVEQMEKNYANTDVWDEIKTIIGNK
jgi:hypothetical protein